MTEVGEGEWRWCFDPEIWGHADKKSDLSLLPALARCPIALIVGEASELIRAEVATYMRGLYPPGTPFIGIPEAGHHVMVDQPLALVAALRSCLAFWPDPTGEPR
jgi:pimeloyl-ACP methyl ester carboxylesterase